MKQIIILVLIVLFSSASYASDVYGAVDTDIETPITYEEEIEGTEEDDILLELSYVNTGIAKKYINNQSESPKFNSSKDCLIKEYYPNGVVKRSKMDLQCLDLLTKRTIQYKQIHNNRKTSLLRKLIGGI